MGDRPISNIYIINDDGVYDPNSLTYLSSILRVDIGTLQNCNVRVSSHGQNESQGSYVNLHEQRAQRRRERELEKERRREEAAIKRRKMEKLKALYPFLNNNHVDEWRSVFNKNHRNEESVFKKTKGYQAIRRTVDMQHVAVILGFPGDGKTTCAKYLVEDYNSHMTMTGPKYEVLYIKSPEDFKARVEPTKFQILIIEDIFGVHSVNLAKVEKWVDFIDTMILVVKSEGSKLRLVMTCGLHLYEKVQKYLHGRIVFQEAHIVDISADGIPLTQEERKEILRSNTGYISHGDSSENLSYSSHSGFPLCCRLYGVSKTFQNLGRTFFNDASKYIPQELGKVESFDATVYSLLVHTALEGGHVNLRGKELGDLNQEMLEKLKKVMRVLKAPTDELEAWILQEAARVLSGVFIMPIQTDNYRIIHHRIIEYILKQFSYGHGQHLIEMASDDIFMEFVKSSQGLEGFHERTSNTYLSNYDILAQRFVFTILQGKIRMAARHQAFTEEKFVTHFFGYLEQQGNLEAVYRARDDTGNSFLFWTAWYGRDLVVKNFVEKESLTRMADDGLGIAEQRILTLLAACYRGGTTEIMGMKIKLKGAPPPIKLTVALSALITAGVPLNATATFDNAETILNFEFALLLKSKAVAIHFAALGNNGPAMKLLLESGADAKARTELGETALHLAVCRDEVEVVKHLIDAGAEVNGKTELGKTPIQDAVYYERTKMTEMLIEAGAEIKILTDDERPLLQVAVANTDLETVKLLLEKGANVNVKGRDGWTPLHEAFYLGDTVTAEHLLDKGAQPYIYTTGGVAPLHEAVANYDRDLIDLLLETGVSVNRSSNSGETPLHIAARKGNMDLIKKLLDMGADLNAKDKNGMLPLNVAAASSHSDVMHYLLERSGMGVPSFGPRQRDPYGRDMDDDYDDYEELMGPLGDMPPYVRRELMRRRRDDLR